MNFPASLQRIDIKQKHIWLYVPDEEVVKKAWQDGRIPFPYWSKVWPAALALSEFLLTYPSYVQDKKIMEIGAGLGLPSLVAAGFAREVLCTDYAEEAIALAERSAVHNGLQNFTTTVADWNNFSIDYDADVLLLSDVNYEPSSFDDLQKTIQTFLLRKTLVIISTPQRLMGKDFISSINHHCIYQQQIVVESKGTKEDVSVFVLHSTS